MAQALVIPMHPVDEQSPTEGTRLIVRHQFGYSEARYINRKFVSIVDLHSECPNVISWGLWPI